MRYRDALDELLHLLATRGATPASLSVPDGIDAMLAFYRDVRADDCELAADGDMLLAQWGTYDRDGRPQFELDLTRQFIAGEGEDDDIWQLSLTFVFPPNALARGNRWCHTPTELAEFAAFVRAHDAYAAATTTPPVLVELGLEPAG